MPRKLTAAKKVELTKQFESWDKSGDGKLNFMEMKALLRKGNPGIGEEECERLFSGADINGDGALDFEEFVSFLYGEKPPAVEEAPEALKKKFEEFAGDQMDGKEFNKLCIDCELIGKGFAKTQVDITFAKVKERGARVIDFKGFEKALNLVATARGVPAKEIFDKVAHSSKLVKGTEAEAVRFHDDKSTYTGAHTQNEKHQGAGGQMGGESEEARHQRLKESSACHSGGPDSDWGGVEKTYRLYDKDNNGLDNREFDKMLDDCGLFNKNFKKNDSAIVFNKALSKGQRKITFDEFKEALRKIADKRHSSTSEVQALVAKSQGPNLKGTQAEAVRFHDDKSSYTGAHAFNEVHGANLGGETEEARHERLKKAANEHDLGPESDWAACQVTYEAYDPQHNGLESKEFKKICEDCGLIGKDFPLTHLDSVFAACKTGRSVDFEGFKECLRRVAAKKSMKISELQAIVGKQDGPVLHGTKAEYNKFHDDKDLYTGTHAGK
jgi:Ca2+-binding EF-hand superfamily protein